jgi:hypothetical protein
LLLILDQYESEFGLGLKRAAEDKGVNTLFVTSAAIARYLTVDFQLTQEVARLRLHFQGQSIDGAEIAGIYCAINAFEPALWSWFSQTDAQYAAAECQALWLAILSSRNCRVVNPPALDTLAGTLLSTPELLELARGIGFRIPTVVTLESGELAADLARSGALARYADLGEPLIQEVALGTDSLPALAQNPDHIRVVEEVPGKAVFVTLVGEDMLVCAPDGPDEWVPLAAETLPPALRDCLRQLHRTLNLNLAEYSLCHLPGGEWVLTGCTRPPYYGVRTYGERLYAHVVNYILGEA